MAKHKKDESTGDNAGAKDSAHVSPAAAVAVIAGETKDEEARLMQEKIEQEARAKAAAISDDERATIEKMRREQEEREKLRPAPPIIKSISAENARPGEDTVTMVFPHAMFIWAEPTESNPSRLKVMFDKGVQEVPKSLADNWYLKSCGVIPYDGAATSDDGPTVEQWVEAGYRAANYPPRGFKPKSSWADIQSAIQKQEATDKEVEKK